MTPLLALFLVALPAGGDGVAWPEADRLFRSDPRWLGGDAAFTVDLGGQRVLWLFGDSFVGSGASAARADAVFVRNTAAVQEGRDPAQATLRFLWREAEDGPRAFLPADGDVWRWPGHGILLDGVLTLFAWRIAADGEGPFGFRAVGWDAFRVEDPSGDPLGWNLQELDGFVTDFPVVMGVALLAQEDHVYAYAVQEPGEHDVYLLRFDRAAFREGRLGDPDWRDGGQWVPQSALVGPPRPVVPRAATELSVQRLADGRLVLVHSQGFGASVVVARTAPAPEGPWSDPVELFRPPEGDVPGTLVYAAKAHPELEGAPLVVTYATNTTDLARLVTDDSLYYPRFLRLSPP